MIRDLPSCDVSLRMKQFSPDEINKILATEISPKHSTDIYNLSPNLLKTVSYSVDVILTVLFNKCLRQGLYPTSLKKVKIAPLYKGKGKKSATKSYRPISLVPVVSKIFEVGLNNRLLRFWTERNVMSECQYAYRRGRSTTDLVREVVRRVLQAREAGLHVAIVCCDLSRAFDTADHSLLAQKLSHYGVRGPALELVISFMTSRGQVVVGDRGRVVSSEEGNLMGVPQGSCVSNTLFSILLNDLPVAMSGTPIYMYADDVTAVVTAESKCKLEHAINTAVERLNDWFAHNGLALNRDKTCYMQFQLNGHQIDKLRVCAGDIPLQQVSSLRLLGFTIDSALTWEHHIESMCGRLGSACFALRRLAHTSGASAGAVRACYYATVYSALCYGTELWARAADWGRVFSMQKRAVRAMAGVPDDESAQDLFWHFNLLPLPCLFIYQAAVFTHVNLQKFARKGVNTAYNLRINKNKDRLVTETHRLKKSEQSIYVFGPTVYNRLPNEVRDAPSTPIFKSRLKKWLHSIKFYNYTDFLNLPLTL